MTSPEINSYQMELTYTTEEFIEAVEKHIQSAKDAVAYWEQVLEDFVNLEGLT